MEKQLNVWIDEAYKEALIQKARRKGVSVKELIECIVVEDIALDQGEKLEREALPIIRDLIQSELKRAQIEQSRQMQEDFHTEIIQPLKKLISQTDKRLSERIAALSVRSVRDGSIIRHLLYSLIAKLVSVSFAREAYEHAKEKAARELEKRLGEKGLLEGEE